MLLIFASFPKRIVSTLKMKNKIKQITNWISSELKTIKLGENLVKGATFGLCIVTSLLWIIYSIGFSSGLNDYWVLLFCLILVIASIVFGVVTLSIIKILSKIPSNYLLAILVVSPLLLLLSLDWVIPILIIFQSSILGAAILVFKKDGFQDLSKFKKILTISGIVIGVGGFITSGILYMKDGFPVEIVNAAQVNKSDIPPISAVAPTANGAYTVKSLTYGSGTDLHRLEYGKEVDLKTNSVNGLAFIDNWAGLGGYWRKKYWGFDAKALPINARVWYPEEKGVFPLVLIVHGNHSMQDFSDIGYNYLCEHLASKGFIVASIDENFFNISWSDYWIGGLNKENDERAWLLLEHLKVWHMWAKTRDHLFYNKIDTSNIALIGHSRGGEAVAHAALFNKLSYYPDDASVKFDYNYNIKSIVAIAPVDRQYESGRSKTVIEDIDYFTIHGSHDGDVRSFMGSQQYERVIFKDSAYHFKAAVYVYGANHGQFNTSWGKNDLTFTPFSGVLNLKQLISAKEQQQIAKVYISSFLDITLKNKRAYLPLFLDARTGKDWLPKTIYLSQFEDSNFKTIANFDEDFDVSTTTLEGGQIFTENLSVWREEKIELNWEKNDSRAVLLGWHQEKKNEKNLDNAFSNSLDASFMINLPSIDIDSSMSFIFSMAESKETPLSKLQGELMESKNYKRQEDIIKEESKKSLDFTITIIDKNGQSISFPLSSFSHLQREVEVILEKTGFLKNEKRSEKVFQTFYFPLIKFHKRNPNFNLSSIKKVRFDFDKNKSGFIIIDNIGFMKSI